MSAPLILPAPVFRGGNLDHYRDRSPASLAWGPAGTGKTLASLFKLVHLAYLYPGTRWFIVRKTKASLAESALVTLENDVFGETSPVLMNRPLMRKTRDYYEMPNRSVIVCAGMDKPEKLFSTEFNGGYVQEAAELEEDEYLSLKRALRAKFTKAKKIDGGLAGKPFRQIILDCNPTYDHHWLKRLMDAGLISGHESRHEHNPRFHNGQDWTEDGREYLDKQLGTLTGFMRKRLLEGLWAAAEGLVYDTFDPKTNILTPAACQEVFGGPLPPVSWPRYWAIDWGWNDPMVLQFWAKDGDGRMYLYRELYQTERLVEDVAAWAAKEIEEKREPRPQAIVCDHDPTNAASFTRHSRLHCTMADKADMRKGIQQVQSRLRIQKDGRARLYITQGALTHAPDAKLRAKGKPTSTIEEMRSYVWNPRKDCPEDANNHGCFVAGTMVYTQRGMTPIESVQIGDSVLSRHGMATVKDSAMTNAAAEIYRLELANGQTIEGTSDHPIWTTQGYKKLGNIICGADEVGYISLWNNYNSRNTNQAKPLSSSTTEQSTGDTQTQNRQAIESTTSPGLSSECTEKITCIGKYTETFTGRYPKAITSTILTKILKIITLQTCVRLQKKITPSITPKRCRQSAGRYMLKSLLNTACQKLRSGIDRLKGVLGIHCTQKKLLKTEKRFRSNARSAGSNTSVFTQVKTSFAGITANQQQEEIRGLTTNPEIASPAVLNSNAIGMLSNSFALVRVVSVKKTNRIAPVYNLTTESGEYVANGILVHNCDSLRYVTVHVESTIGGWGIR